MHTGKLSVENFGSDAEDAFPPEKWKTFSEKTGVRLQFYTPNAIILTSDQRDILLDKIRWFENEIERLKMREQHLSRGYALAQTRVIG